MKLIRLTVLSLLMLSGTCLATPIYHPPGPNLIYGAISNNQSIMSEVTNPAAGASALLEEKSRYRFGILSSIGFGYEFGDVNNLYDEIDRTITTLSETQSLDMQAIVDAQAIDPGLFATDTAYRDQKVSAVANAAANEINTNVVNPLNYLQQLVDKEGYFKGFASGHVPLMPFVISHRGLGGSFTLDANVAVAGFLDFLGDDIPQFTEADIYTSIEQTLQQTVSGGGGANLLYDVLASDSTLLVKGAYISEVSLGYSWITMNHALGNLFTGVRAKYYQAKLTQYAQRLSDLSSTQNSEDIYNDQKDADYQQSAALGLDAGVLWVADNYRAGATIDNINKPSFKYPTLALTDSLGSMNYDTTGSVYNSLRKGSTYEMKPQLRLEGGLFTRNTNWVVGGSLDVNAVEDPFAQEFQWATVSAAYAASKFYIPGVRLGYRTNLAGSKQSYAGIGLTWLTINFDIAYGLDEIKYMDNGKQKKAPRSALFNIGWAMTF